MRLLKLVVLFVVGFWVATCWSATLHILTTSDMHGALQPTQVGDKWVGGAAEMLAYWKQVEGYRPGRFLTISCGDLVTSGPQPLAEYLKGDPVIETMNYMRYDVCVLGNHEFDLGIDRLKSWRKLASFPLLAANLVTADGKPSDVATPYVILENQGLKVGVIGLIVADLPAISSNVKKAGLSTTSYVKALRKYVPEMRAKGAQVIIVGAHAGAADLAKVAEEVNDLNIPLFLAGHWHETGLLEAAGGATWIVSSGEYWRTYCRIDLDVDPQTGKAALLSSHIVRLEQTAPEADPTLKAKIAGWKKGTDEILQHAENRVDRPRIVIPCLAQAPTMDGTIEMNEWPAVAAISRFSLIGGAERPELPTKVWVGVDTNNLYAAFRCTLPPGSAPIAKGTEGNGNVCEDDSIECFIWPDESSDRYYQLVANSAGTKFAALFSFNRGGRNRTDAAWNPHWIARGKTDRDAWTLEMSIPLADLGITPQGSKSFRLNFIRNAQSGPDRYQSWAPLPILNFHVPSEYGVAECTFPKQ